MRVSKFFVAALAAGATAAIVIPVEASAEVDLTSGMVNDSTSNTVKWGKWSNSNFSLTYPITTGFGLTPYYNDYSTGYVSFYIGDYDYTTFEAYIGNHEPNRTGDLGSSTIEIYADNELIYTKNFTNKTDAEFVQAQIPAGTKELLVYTSYTKGAQGRHALIIGDPKLTNAMPSIDKVDMLGLRMIGASSYDNYYTSVWSNSSAQVLGEKAVSRGIGFSPYYTDEETAYAEYKISDYNYTTFEATVGIDARYASGDRGKTTLEIFSNGKLIYSKVMTNKTEPEDIAVAIPKETNYLRIVTSHDKGTQGKHRVVLDHPRLTNKFEQVPALDSVAVSYKQLVSEQSDNAYRFSYSDNQVFTDAAGNPLSVSIGLKPYYSSDREAYATVFVGDDSYKYFDTIFTLDGQYMSGDRGTAKVIVYADNRQIGSVDLSKSKPEVKFTKEIPTGTKYLKLYGSFTGGTSGTLGVIAKHPVLRNGLSDMPNTDIYYNAVNYLSSKNIINGYPDGTFKADNTLTRGHAAMLVARALQLPNATSMKFTDVPKSQNGYGEIAAVVNAGYFDSFVTGNKFDQNQPLTRGEMADIITKAFNLERTSAQAPFKDVSTYWAKDSITALYDNKITLGHTDNTFKANDTLTRGHFSLFMARAMNESFR